MNPRIQVEHTVTEEATGVDLVLAQLRIAAGATLADLGLRQERIAVQRTAIQCRITTEDPSDEFRPSTGTILEYRAPGGPGIRLDGAAYAGATVTPFYDSLLVKMTTTGPDFDAAARRARRGLSDFSIRGVATNIAFLQGLLADSDFLAGDLSTAFLEEHPGLLAGTPGAHLGESGGLLLRLAETTVNRPHGNARTTVRDPAERLTRLDQVRRAPQRTAKQVLDEQGPLALADWLRSRPEVVVTDTTLRDAHQSLLATRVRTIDLEVGARATAALLPGLFSLECWGGATFDASLRFLGEDPWQRLERLRAAAPGLLTQMLVRGRNLLGYAPYPNEVVDAFVDHARQTGMDVFRVFDALNDVERSRPVIDAVREHGGYAEAAICYTADLLAPDEPAYTLDYYLQIAERYQAAGAHGLVIKDMAGLLRPRAARVLVDAIRSRFGLPLRLHTHDTAGGQMATLMAAIEAGVDGVDAAAAPMSSGGSQPSLGGLLAALQHDPRDPGPIGGLDARDAMELEPYWSAVRDLYAPFEAGQRAPSTAVYHHEVPGGQLSNLSAQAQALGIANMDEVLDAYQQASVLLGRPVKVTPSSKVVGDLAVWMVAAGVSADELLAEPSGRDLPASVIAYLQGQLGTPTPGFLQPFTEQVLAGRPRYAEADLQASTIDDLADPIMRRVALTRLMLPAQAADYERLRETYGDVSCIPSRAFLFGLEHGQVEAITLAPGRQLFVELEAVGDVDHTGRRSVHLRANGQPIALRVIDEHAPAPANPRPKAEAGNPAHIAATVPGVVHLQAVVGEAVRLGQRIAVIEAMKMEAPITATVDGTIASIAILTGSHVEPGDLIAEVAATAE